MILSQRVVLLECGDGFCHSTESCELASMINVTITVCCDIMQVMSARVIVVPSSFITCY